MRYLAIICGGAIGLLGVLDAVARRAERLEWAFAERAQGSAPLVAAIDASTGLVAWPLAQGGQPAPTAPRGPLEVILSGGATGVAIILILVVISIIALALAVEHVLTIRRSLLTPDGLGEQVRVQLGEGKLPEADRTCQSQPSALSAVLRAGFAETVGGWPAVEKAMEETLAEQAARLLRKIDYLSVIGNIAPMVGLLGTVFGMIFAFQEVADTQGVARASELASGIYQALVTTVGGLLVAIPSLAAFAVFRNRVDHLIAETGYEAQRAVAPLKRSLLSRTGNRPASA